MLSACSCVRHGPRSGLQISIGIPARRLVQPMQSPFAPFLILHAKRRRLRAATCASHNLAACIARCCTSCKLCDTSMHQFTSCSFQDEAPSRLQPRASFVGSTRHLNRSSAATVRRPSDSQLTCAAIMPAPPPPPPNQDHITLEQVPAATVPAICQR